MSGKKLAMVYYADLWGLRDEKYKNLFKNDVTTTQWQKLEPSEPYYFLVPKDFDKFMEVHNIHTDQLLLEYVRICEIKLTAIECHFDYLSGIDLPSTLDEFPHPDNACYRILRAYIAQFTVHN